MGVLGSLRGCLVSVFKQQFSVFKQHFTYFNTLFHPHVFPQKFLNNNFQFLNTCTKRALETEKNIGMRTEKLEGVFGECFQTTVFSF